MDVRCGRCGTEYEFDDALISERGTSVRCTQCGHQFRVHPATASTVGPDEWVVITGLGERIIYRTLRDLQKGISRAEVGRDDLLSRGKRPPRPLGGIAELAPFFPGAYTPAPVRQPKTLAGVGMSEVPVASSTGPQGGRPPRVHETLGGVAPPANPPRTVNDPVDRAVPPGEWASAPHRLASTGTVLGIGEAARSAPIDPNQGSTRTPSGGHAAMPVPTQAFAEIEPGTADPALSAIGPRGGERSTPKPPSFERVAASGMADMVTPRPPHATAAVGASSRADKSAEVAVVADGKSAEVAVAADGKSADVAVAADGKSADVAVAADGKSAEVAVAADGKSAEVAVAADGKSAEVAVAADGKSAEVAAAAPGVEPHPAATPPKVAQAEPSDSDAHEVPRFVSSEPPTIRRPSVNCEIPQPTFLTSDTEQPGRFHDVPSLQATSSAPPSSGVPSSSPVELSRQRVVASSAKSDHRRNPSPAPSLGRSNSVVPVEPPPGDGLVRWVAVAAIVLLAGVSSFALVSWWKHNQRVDQSSEAVGAIVPVRAEAVPSAVPSEPPPSQEASRVSAMPVAQPTVTSAPAPAVSTDGAPIDGGVAADAGVGDPTSLLALERKLLEGDVGTRLRRAGELLRKGDSAFARRLYVSVLAQRPNDTEALSGLGDVARARGESTGAVAFYEKALAINPGYLPALSSAADIKWRTGNRAGAAALYRRVVERYGENTVSGRLAAARLKQMEPASSAAAEGSGVVRPADVPPVPSPGADGAARPANPSRPTADEAPAVAPVPPAPPPAPVVPPPPVPPAPNVDTTDLPELGR